MSYRKKLKNQETFHFDENDVLPAPPVPVHKKKSVQARLAPKAGTGNLGHYGVGVGIPPRTMAAGHQSSATPGHLATASSSENADTVSSTRSELECPVCLEEMRPPKK